MKYYYKFLSFRITILGYSILKMFLLFLIKNVSFGEDERRCAIVAATKEKRTRGWSTGNDQQVAIHGRQARVIVPARIYGTKYFSIIIIIIFIF
jgi:hypothetical protein